MKLSDSPRQPLLGLALSAISGILLAEFFAPPVDLLCGGVALGAAVLLVRPVAGLTHLLVAAVFFALHLVVLMDSPGRAFEARLGERMRPVVVRGIVASEPKAAPNDFTTFLLQLETVDVGTGPQPCSATIRARWKGNPRFGDEITLKGIVEPIERARNPGGFDLRTYLARRDVFQSVFARYRENGVILQSGVGNLLVRSAMRAREWMRATLSRGLEDSPEVTALINGMALGLRHETADDIEAPFQETGTLHLFAVAGLHVGIIARLLWIIASLCRLPRKAAAALIIPCLFFYSAITGFHVSSVRAATMAAVLLGGSFFDRPVLALNSLAGAALLILAVDSNQIFTSGFQLSFAVVGAILLWQNGIFRLLLRPTETDPFLPRSLVSRQRRTFENGYRWVAGGISVSAAAWIGSLLLILWYFYLITPISLLANLTVVPVAFCLLAVGLISLVGAPFSHVFSLIFNNANWSLAKAIFALVQVFSQLPSGHSYVERPHWPSGAGAEITVLDAGAGAAVHLRAPGADWLFDGGSARDYERFLRDYLHSRGIDRLDGLLFSHGDSLHIGGARSVLDEFRPRRVLDNAAPDRSSVHGALFQDRPAPEKVKRGDLLVLSRRVTAHVLFPEAGTKEKAADDQALVVQLVIEGKWRVLLVSDSGLKTEAALRALPHENLQSDILIKGQHYSGLSGSSAFLDAVRPELIVATSCDFPARERIPDDWARLVRQKGIRLFRQDETGAVKLEFFRGHWEAAAFLDQETFRSSSR
ncbi:MAG TPA: ComEC/Rec2 family competence protein [Chthoniobacterales bacterium]|nr:ComEC/Rec2 family competence protein [Chthoniobacterales bacterium]